MRLSGVAVVDRVIGGIAPGLPLVLAGPPGCGRTVLALEIAAAALRENDIVAFLSSEPASLLLRQAETLSLDLETPVRSEQLLLLEIVPSASSSLATAGGRALVEAVLAEHPSVSLLIIDAFSSLITEILDEAPLRAVARELVAATPRTTLVLTVETERPVLDAPVEKALAEVCGSFLIAGRDADGRRTLTLEKTRAGAGPAEAVQFEIGREGTTLLRDIVPQSARRRAARGAAPEVVQSRVEPAALRAAALPDREERAEAPAPVATALPPAPARASPARRERKGRARILLIDSDASAQSEIGGWLRERYDLVTARDGFQGVAKLLGERPDLIVIDLVLDRVSGLEVIAALHQSNSATPLLVVTSRVERHGDRMGPLVLGATDVLIKPVDRFGLLHKVETALRLDPPSSPAVDPLEAGRLFAPTDASRVLSPGEFRERVERACDFGERIGIASTLVALETSGGELLDRLVGAAEAALRLEDAISAVSKRRLLVLLVAADSAQARLPIERLVNAAQRGPEERLRIAVGPAAPDGGDTWKALFAELLPWDRAPAEKRASRDETPAEKRASRGELPGERASRDEPSEEDATRDEPSGERA